MSGIKDALVNVVILNWNGGDFLPDCLAALARQTYPTYTVTIVDNGSTDGSIAWVRHHYPAIEVIETGVNLGFAAGNNVALESTSADIVTLLNPDVIPSPDWLSNLVDVMSSDPRIGIVGSKLWYPDGQTIQHAGGFIRKPQAMPGHFAIGERDTGQADSLIDVEYVIGGAVAIRREVLGQIGLLDEGFFLYYEDADYCQRARAARRRVVYAPSATAIHIESATAVKGSFGYLQRFHTGRWRYLLKYYGEQAILTDTVAAERQWLAAIDFGERLAAAFAYQMTLADWADIEDARARQGIGPLATDIGTIIRGELVGLRDLAWSLAKPPIDPGPLRSQAHVIAPQLAADNAPGGKFREAWNSIAARWYIEPILAQQNTFNQVLAEGIAAEQSVLEADFAERLLRLSELQAMQAMLQRETRQLVRMSQEAAVLVDDLESQLAALAAARGEAPTGE